jgi:anaerobic selenocysteine-containing dehydrogenase
MKHEELKDETLVASTEDAAQTPESAQRRSFMKGLAAGTAAAGVLAGTVAKAATPIAKAAAQERLSVRPRRQAAQLRLTFPKGRPPKLYEVVRALEAVLEPTGCTACGFDGIDILLRLDEVIGPDPKQWVATLEGELVAGQ